MLPPVRRGIPGNIALPIIGAGVDPAGGDGVHPNPARQADRQRRMEEARVQEQQRKQEEQKKKTLREKQQAAQAAKAVKAAKAATSTTEAGRVGDRPYARGRAYKADRYDET